ncbi:hypothetical protein [Acetobacterium tundrae]|uniref:Uncharacterized protein n=1 Tax=Acetobacterium tundrae TaxID=132932 RepID=A0ABR6WND9_9FIRM|nr:hypothetical protein [Acetobacterium tundrae]MBC3798018.1 hypothetical protein [Acetobacterium tundrae]
MAGKINGFNELALTIHKRIEAVGETSLIIDFGQINEDGSLRTNSYPQDVPSNSYLICGNLLDNDCTCESAGDPAHAHAIKTEKRIAIGARVVVAWVGNDAIVVDVMKTASEVL